VVVIDQDVLAVLVGVEAVQVQAGDLADPPAGALEQLVGEHRERADLLTEHAEGGTPGGASGAGDRCQQVLLRVELGDDVRG
jgi:hypothetical protein